MAKRKVEFDTEDQELGRQKAPWLQRIAASKYGMAATANYNATQVAETILAQNGNAADAAVAAAFALGVCEPAASGLGGQTMVLCCFIMRKPKKPSP
jgi:gamma-glutamyltranspeptidase/glutathione hydrolase